MDRKKAARIYSILEKEYPGAKTALKHEDAFQLMVATILSAQCTDKRVNIVTEQLFREYKSAKDLSAEDLVDIERIIMSTGFYKNKARHIVGAARKIEKEFGGIVPSSMEELVKLPGVARKTANIVLFHAFGKNEGVAVDTHVKRISARLGFTRNQDPVKIERDLMALFDRKEWGHLTNILIAHGREVCVARKPSCGVCPVKSFCPSAG